MSAPKVRSALIDRRTALLGVAGCCLAAPVLAGPEDELPQKGDSLVVAEGDAEGKPFTIDLVTVDGEPVLCVAKDPASGVQRTESRFGKVVLVRLAEADIDEDTKPHTVDGVIALSAICTHQGCTVNGWDKDEKALLCFCHGSKFVPGEGGRVAHGPARKRLPVLPLNKDDKGNIIVAGGFIGKPGPSAT
jgi:rieske iron-sulfur protein